MPPAYTLNGADFSRARVALPAYGIWTALVELVAAKAFAAGTPAQLVVGDLVLVGTVQRGGTYAGLARYRVVGGAGGWSKGVKARNYRDDRGFTLAQVAGDIASEVGEQLVVEAGADRPLGGTWSRFASPDPTGIASMALRRLAGGRWWVGADGVTHVGARPVTLVPSTVRFAATDYDPALPRAVVMSPDDAIAAFVPGARWSYEEIKDFTITAAHVRASAGSVAVEVLG